MKVLLLSVGKPRGNIAELIADYEKRIGHYFDFESAEVREATGRNVRELDAMEEEGSRLLARIPEHYELFALDRKGDRWSSLKLARHIEEGNLTARPGIAFVIGGAYGLSDKLIQRTRKLLSLSAMTFPHELARLMLVEQIYRAGTLIRGEPYHKGPGLR